MDPLQWILQPLVDAGLPPRTITDLLFRLSFEILTPDDAPDDGARAVVDGYPATVQAAWVETLSRMIAAGEPTSWTSQPEENGTTVQSRTP